MTQPGICRRRRGAVAVAARIRASRRALCLALLAAAVLLGVGMPYTARAIPGNAWIALSPAPDAGELDVDVYVADPCGWPAAATEHNRGWAVAYRDRQPPAGWSRPFLLRGGGSASREGVLRPQFAAALDEMLSARETAILTLLDPPDSAACSPGKPNPHPFFRDGWLCVHDGYIGIEDITMQIWRADWGPAWDTFKTLHPRDFHAKGDSSRGNAGEIYFLTFLYELSADSQDVVGALERAVYRMWDLDRVGAYQLNLVLQAGDGTWAVRYALADEERYPIFHGFTTAGEHWIADEVPPGVAEWEEVPNFALAVFAPDAPVELHSLIACDVSEPGHGDAYGWAKQGRVRIWAERSPCLGPLNLGYEIPRDVRGLLEVWDIEGRLLLRQSVPGGCGGVEWFPPGRCGAGLYLARIRFGAVEERVRILRLK